MFVIHSRKDQGCPVMNNFNPADFQGWFDQISPDMLSKLEQFGDLMGVGNVIISPAAGAVGRNLGQVSTSQHNVDFWGEVRAIDVMILSGTLQDAYLKAIEAGFSGIGVYPDWKPYPGLHLDVRDNNLAGTPATWAGVRNVAGEQVYTGVDRAWI